MQYLQRLLIPFSLLFLSFNSIASYPIQRPAIHQPNEICLTLMPCPKQLIKGNGSFTLTQRPKLFISGMSDKRKSAAIKRLTGQFNRIHGFTFQGFTSVKKSELADLTVIIEPDNNHGKSYYLPTLGANESYQLAISKENIRITAKSDFGALHALTSLIQISSLAELSPKDAQKKVLTLPVVNIVDDPRFKWRGLLIDSVRHFISIDTIKRQLDGMAGAKLNVFHWHLTDDQGWRIESKTYPKLHLLASDGLFYSQEEIKDVVSYASDLGIRVVPEFDFPGHASAIAVAYPEFMTEQKSYVMQRHWGVFEPLLNVANPKIYEFIDTLLKEFTPLFPDEYLHIGGDEVNPKHWQNSQDINALKLANNLADSEDVHSFFNIKLQKILAKHQRKMMGWDEVFHDDLPKDVVVQSWRGLQSLNVIASSGYQGLLSAGFYIDQPQATSYHYRNYPLANLVLPDEKLNEKSNLELNEKQNTKAKQARLIKSKANEHWQTWAFTIPRLKGSAVSSLLTLIVDEKNGTQRAYLKLNQHYHQQVTIHSSKRDLHQKHLVFSFDSWMGPMRFELNLAHEKPVSGFTFIGNSYYPIQGKTDIPEQKQAIALQPLLTLDEAKNILGGEATLWSEMVDDKNIDLRTWPRLFAIAERFWSPKSITDSQYMYQRLMMINGYADDIIGLKHQQQQLSGLSQLLSLSSDKKDDVEALLTLAQALEPAHYYTRHHLKHLNNEYHQQARLDNFVDYLPVESFSVLKMQNELLRYQQGELSSLLTIKQQLVLWQKNTQRVSSLIKQEAKLRSLKQIVADMKVFNELALTLVNRCIDKDFYNAKEASKVNVRLIALQKETREIVIAAVPFTRELLSQCQISNDQ